MVARPVLAGSLALAAMTGCGGDGTADAPATAPPPLATTPADGTGADRPRGQVLRGPVVFVSDGDTIGVRLSGRTDRIRLLGIDAPETRPPRGPVDCFGPEASAALRRVLPRGSTVTIVTDPVQDTRDRFGRLLGYVFRQRERIPVNERMLEIGAARVYVFRDRPFLRLPAFRAAEARARAAGRGLWGTCP